MLFSCRVSIIVAAIVALAGCDAVSDATGIGGGSSTTCQYAYGASGTAEDFGQACTADSDCAHNVCMMPGENGNITNEVFGFCTRGCDCDESQDATLAGSDPNYDCVYPGGCYVGTSQGAWRYAAPKCASIDDCLSIDSRYTHCADTNQMTVVEETCGLHKVCQAHN